VNGFMVEVIRKSSGKVTDRAEFGTYAEVLVFLRTVNTKIYRTVVYS